MKRLLCVAAALVTAACAVRGPVRQIEPRAPAPETAQQPPVEPVEKSKVNVVPFSIRTLPPRSNVQTIEAADPRLAAALLKLAFVQTAENHRAVADEYMRLGILDKADEFLSAAVEIDPHDAAAWDRKARIWRDWGWPKLALPHAIRAVHFAPSSHEARNTLGTVLQALGRHGEARAEYEQALRLDAALNNVCQNLTDRAASDGGGSCDLAYATGDKLNRRLSPSPLTYGPVANTSEPAQALAPQKP